MLLDLDLNWRPWLRLPGTKSASYLNWFLLFMSILPLATAVHVPTVTGPVCPSMVGKPPRVPQGHRSSEFGWAALELRPSFTVSLMYKHIFMHQNFTLTLAYSCWAPMIISIGSNHSFSEPTCGSLYGGYFSNIISNFRDYPMIQAELLAVFCK